MHHIVVLISRLTLGVIWVTAAMAKLLTPGSGSEAVEELSFLRGLPARALGFVLPWAELGLGLLLVAGEAIRAAAAASGALLTAFGAAMVLGLLRGRRVRCNCFGQLRHEYVSWASVVRNAALLALAVVSLLVRSDYLSLRRLLVGRPVLPGEPGLSILPPLMLTWLAVALGWVLASAMWAGLRATARAVGGPADSLPEARWLRRAMRLEAAQPPQTLDNGG